MEKEKKLLNDFIESLKLNEDVVTTEDFYKAVKNANMDRTTQVYFIWKKIKELYPEIDANKIIREGSWDFGLFQGNQIAQKYGAENIGPMEAVLGQTSKSGWFVFEQEITEFNDEKAVKMFNACPHVEALQRLSVSKELIKEFCRDMLGYCDYAICHTFPNVEIDFPTTVADGEGYGCAMTITRKK
ncbi:MAG: L-2-amino-thiazoline-4-carboxylic acid hydrolase [Tissierellia bacterium]|nr:L-2-amino-thiazoline-4-carboxylic acid hydrolase [Tissierellia bacterium]